jgi:ribosomal protein L37AE/L43A
MVDEKDRLGEKLRSKQKAEEDRFFSDRDKALIEKLRREKSAAQAEQARDTALMRCPKCGEKLVEMTQAEVVVDECPACGGMWLDKGELETLASRERDSWLGRFFFRPRR